MSKMVKNEKLTELRKEVAKSPTKPGTYRWLNKSGDILYIGKAKNLRNRLKSYVQPNAKLGPWKDMLMKNAAALEYTVTTTELEALVLETNLIKEHRPKYNVLMKDDKNYVYAKVTVQDHFPRIGIIRRMEDDGAKYFGPFLSARELEYTLEMLDLVYRYSACKGSLEKLNKICDQDGELTDAKRKTPCLDHQIGKCNGLCIGEVEPDDYKERIQNVMRFFRGDKSHVIKSLTELMEEAAVEEKFEKAAKMRDVLSRMQSSEKQQVSDTTGANSDFIGIALQAGKGHAVLLRERNGRVVNELSFGVQGEAESAAEALAELLPQYYSATQDIPDTVILGEEVDGQQVLEEWLTDRRGKKVTIHIPERGKKNKLLQLAETNAHEKLKQQFTKWELAEKNIETALTELKDALQLQDKPKRIECYDISHLNGTETVGSMSVFLNGKPETKHYRNFTIRTMKSGEIDDYKALKEVLMRRLRHLQVHISQEEERWREQNVTVSKARKADQNTLEEHVTESDAIDYKNFLVARKEDEIIACGQLLAHTDKTVELRSVWVEEQYQAQQLGNFVARKLLAKVKKGKIYIAINPLQEENYARMGFRHVQNAPKALAEREDETIVMMYDSQQNKEDASLTSTPDLLVLDGGKGQLSSGVEVLNAMNLEIPIASLAKREEEVFIPGSKTPLPLRKDSEGRFLLMRLRDEAHRFANRHRERRIKHALVND